MKRHAGGVRSRNKLAEYTYRPLRRIHTFFSWNKCDGRLQEGSWKSIWRGIDLQKTELIKIWQRLIGQKGQGCRLSSKYLSHDFRTRVSTTSSEKAAKTRCMKSLRSTFWSQAPPREASAAARKESAAVSRSFAATSRRREVRRRRPDPAHSCRRLRPAELASGSSARFPDRRIPDYWTEEPERHLSRAEKRRNESKRTSGKQKWRRKRLLTIGERWGNRSAENGSGREMEQLEYGKGNETQRNSDQSN